MELTPRLDASLQFIQGYGPGIFRVSDREIQGPIVVHRSGVVTWNVSAFADLTADLLLTAGRQFADIEVLLLGCGSRIQLLPSAVRRAVREGGFSVEPMATDAACRTYNVLLSEDRRVAAALLPIDL